MGQANLESYQNHFYGPKWTDTVKLQAPPLDSEAILLSCAHFHKPEFSCSSHEKSVATATTNMQYIYV